MVWVDHGTFVSRSLHMINGSQVVHHGQHVTEGQALGTMGATGGNYGVHLHLEIVAKGVQVDPVPYIQDRINQTPQEDSMTHSISVNSNIYAIGKQFISHYNTIEQATITRQVTSVNDELHTLSLSQFVDLLDGLGVPRSVLDAQGKVLNPQSGIHEWNGVWSREREILAKLATL